jgi:DNA repair exonuclease SbcCD ATPase subunit
MRPLYALFGIISLIYVPTQVMSEPWDIFKDPPTRLENGIESYSRDYDELITKLDRSFDRLKGTPDRVVTELEDAREEVEKILKDTSGDGYVIERMEAAREFYNKRLNEARSDRSMDFKQKSEVIEGWENAITELDVLQGEVQGRSEYLRELYQDLGGELEYHIHLEQLEEAERLHASVRELVKRMDEAIRRLQKLSTPIS